MTRANAGHFAADFRRSANKMKPIAQTTFWIGKKGQARSRADLKIYRPELNPTGTGEYRCRVLAPGTPEARFIYGEDSVQALMLGIAYAIIHIDALTASGWSFYFRRRDRKMVAPQSLWMLRTNEAEPSLSPAGDNTKDPP